MDLAKELRGVRMPNGAILGLNWAGAGELERQREVIADLEAQLTQAAEAERAAVVKWLRAGGPYKYPGAATIAAHQTLAAAIEARAHL